MAKLIRNHFNAPAAWKYYAPASELQNTGRKLHIHHP
jgi:hypothetical protein